MGLVSCSKFVEFTDFYVAFDTSSSSSTAVNCKGNTTGEYVVRLCSTIPDEAITVTFSVTPGNGLAEGTDYVVESPSTYDKATRTGTLKFLPGIWTAKIGIRWIAGEIDEEKDNTVTIRLENASTDIGLGYPGPDEKNREYTIRKFK